MSCCKQQDKDPKKKDACCVCNPFEQDGFLLTAQISSIIAACISWTWWPVFVVAAPIVAILQITWCCRMAKSGLVAATILSFLAGVGSLFTGAWLITRCPRQIFVIVMDTFDDDYYSDSCSSNYYGAGRLTSWAVVAFVDSFLFFLTAMCTLHFILNRYDDIAAKQQLDRKQQEEDEVIVVATDIKVHAVEMIESSSYLAPEVTEASLPSMAKGDNAV